MRAAPSPWRRARRCTSIFDTSPLYKYRIAGRDAERFLSGPLVAGFAEAHPGITLDVTVSDDPIDLVAGGFDAGVRLGEVIEQDMVAVPLTASGALVITPNAGLRAVETAVTVDAAVSNDLFYFNHVPLKIDNLAIVAPDGRADSSGCASSA